jgi:hypothetical protein
MLAIGRSRRDALNYDRDQHQSHDYNRNHKHGHTHEHKHGRGYRRHSQSQSQTIIIVIVITAKHTTKTTTAYNLPPTTTTQPPSTIQYNIQACNHKNRCRRRRGTRSQTTAKMLVASAKPLPLRVVCRVASIVGGGQGRANIHTQGLENDV